MVPAFSSVQQEKPSHHSGINFRAGQSPETLAQMCRAFDVVETYCSHCRQRGTLTPPFNIDVFSCPRCEARIHPFVWVEGHTVDLTVMRETLAAIHFDPLVAERTLRALRREPHRSTPFEPLLHVPTVAAHAIASCLRWSRAGAPWWTLVGIVHPAFLAALLPAVARRSARVRREETKRLLAAPLAKMTFDPRALPSIQEHSQIMVVLGQLDLNGAWPAFVNGGLENYENLGATEHSSWSIVFDRREQLDKRASGSAVLNRFEFVDEVVREVSQAESDGEIVTLERSVVLMPGTEAPSGREFVEGEREVSPFAIEAQRSPRARRSWIPTRVLEVLDFKDGNVAWSFLRSQARGPLIGLRWATFYRGACAGGAFVDGKHVDPMLEMEREQEREAILREAGTLSEKMLDAIPNEFITYIVLTAILAWVWFKVMGLAADEEAATALSVLGRGACAVIFGGYFWNKGRRRRYPFPREFWPLKALPWAEATERRKHVIALRIKGLWKILDRSPVVPLSMVLGTIRHRDRLDRETRAFVVHCQDRLITDGIITVGERHGIDMSKFKEGIQHINNYGVIANRIDGPVAAGDGARAEQEKHESLLTKVGHKVAGQQSAEPNRKVGS